MARASAFWSRWGSVSATWLATGPRPSASRRVRPRSRARRSRSRYGRDQKRADARPGVVTRWAATSTFWSTVYSRNSVVAWNVRAIPRRQISDGRSPDVRSPLKKTSPAVSGITPVIRLKTVLLPAPLGPIRPWIAPRATVMERSATASKPPNRRETPRSSRSKADSRSCGRPSARSPEKAPGRARKGHQSLGREEHGEDENGAEDEDLVVVELAQELGRDGHEDGPNHRPPDAPRAADDGEDDQQHHRLQAEVAGVKDLAEMGEEDAGEPGNEAPENEGGQLVAKDVHAHRLGQEAVQLELSVEGEPEQPVGLGNSHQPRGAPEQPLEEIIEEEPDHLREGERDEEVVGAAHTQGDAADGYGERGGHERTDPERGPEGQPNPRHQQGRGVGSDPHEGDVSHVDLSRAHLKAKAHGQREVHEDGGSDVQVIGVARHEGQDGGGEGDEGDAGGRDAAAAARLHRRAPAVGRATPRSP